MTVFLARWQNAQRAPNGTFEKPDLRTPRRLLYIPDRLSTVGGLADDQLGDMFRPRSVRQSSLRHADGPDRRDYPADPAAAKMFGSPRGAGGGWWTKACGNWASRRRGAKVQSRSPGLIPVRHRLRPRPFRRVGSVPMPLCA